MFIPAESIVADYFDLRTQLDELAKDVTDVITHPSYILPFLQSGRLVKVKFDQKDFGWGIVVAFSKRTQPKVKGSLASPSSQNLTDHSAYGVFSART